MRMQRRVALAFVLAVLVCVYAADEADTAGRAASPFGGAMSSKLERAKKLHGQYMRQGGIEGRSNVQMKKVSARDPVSAHPIKTMLKPAYNMQAAPAMKGTSAKKQEMKRLVKIEKKAQKMQQRAQANVKKTRAAGMKEASKAVKKAASLVSAAKQQAKGIVEAAQKRAREIDASAKARAPKAQPALQQMNTEANVKANALLTKARLVEKQAAADGARAKRAAHAAVEARQASQQRVQKAKGFLQKAQVLKTFAKAKAVQQNEKSQKKTIAAEQYKQKAKMMARQADASKDALTREIAHEQRLSAADKAMATKLKQTQSKAKLDRQRARKELEKAEKAKSTIKLAAKSAIRRAVKNAAVIALAQKKKIMSLAAKERAGKNLGTANTLAAQAQTAAEERMAKQAERKARRQMARVQAEKRRALRQVQSRVKRSARKLVKHSKYAKEAKVEGKELARANRRNNKLKKQLKEAHTGTTATTLLSRMYRPLPYERACGSLSKDPRKLRQTRAKTVGACAAKCATLAKCQSFQFSKKLCTLSSKKLLRPSKYGSMLACPTRNVLITASMKLSSTPSVFEKRPQLGESDEVTKRTVHKKASKHVKKAAQKKKASKHVKKAAQKKKARTASKKVQKRRKSVKKQHARPARKRSKTHKVSKEVTKTAKRARKAEKRAVKRQAGGSKSARSPAMCSAKLKSMLSALGECRNGIRQIIAKAKASNHRIVQLAQQRQQRALRGEKRLLDRKMDSALARRVGRDGAKMKAELASARVMMKKRYVGKGALRLEAAKDAKSAAMRALSGSMHFSHNEKKKLNKATLLAKAYGKEKIQAAKRKKQRVLVMREMAKQSKKRDKDETRQRKQMKQLAKSEAKAVARANHRQTKLADLMEEKTMMKEKDAAMAVGLKAAFKEIKHLKAAIATMKGRVKAVSKKHKRGLRDVLKAHGAFKRCSKSKIAQLKAARVAFKAAVKKEGPKQMLANTRVELARRALAMCEKRNKGSTNKAVARLKQRTKRAVKREKRKLNKKKAKKKMKKAVKLKQKLKLKKKLKKKEAKKEAKKVKKLVKKKLSPKCKACKKLSKAEKTVLGADCKAC